MPTIVVFRKFPDGDVIALFPEIEWNHRGDFSSYLHIGQHGGASPALVQSTKPATPTEYADLLAELETIGYTDLVIRKRINRGRR